MKKSLKRKLLLSGLAMGVAAISLGSTTYAWFSNIDTVTASNSGVSVAVPTSILLHDADSKIDASATGWKSALSLVDLATSVENADGVADASITNKSQVNPVKMSRGDGALPTFQELKSESKKLVQEDGTIADEASHLTTSSSDVFNDNFNIKYDGQSGTTIGAKPTLTITKGDQALDAHVMFVVYEYDGSSWTEVVAPTPFSTLSADSWGTFNLSSGSTRCFSVYVYVNHTCKNSDVTKDLSEYSVNITFTKTASV